MHAVYFEVAPHQDIARLDLEDGLIRQAAASLTATASTIKEIVVDVPRERTIDLAGSNDGPSASPAVVIEAEEEGDTAVELDHLLAEVATVQSAWSAKLSTLIEPSREWAGVVTPGVKLRLSGSAAPGINSASFEQFVADSLLRCADRCDGLLALTLAQSIGQASNPPHAVAGFSFVDDQALDAALVASAFTPFARSELMQAASLHIAAVSEHRIAPNPNTWV